MKKIKIIFFFLFLISISTRAGEKKTFLIGIGTHQGFFLNHSPGKSGYPNKKSLGDFQTYEATILFPCLGTKSWHREYNYPTWGITAGYLNMNQTVLPGYGLSLIIHNSINLLDNRYKYGILIRLGTGIGHFSNTYNKINNPNNKYLSAAINCAMYAHIENRFQITPKFQIYIGGSFTHYSNGALSMPNLGINLPSLDAGIRYTVNSQNNKIIEQTEHQKIKKNTFYVGVTGGMKKKPDYGTKPYYTYSMSFTYGLKLRNIGKLLIGHDAFYDGSYKNDSAGITTIPQIGKLGISIGHEWQMGKLSLIFAFGQYYYNKVEPFKENREKQNYIRAGLRYHIFPNWYGLFCLKTHWGRADNFEFGTGISL